MPWWAVSVVLLVAGCNKLFDLEPVDPANPYGDAGVENAGDSRGTDTAAPACIPSGFDEDSDGLDDICDGCPTIASTPDDTDGDGLPDDCDSSMTTAEEIKAFWTFSGSTSSSSLTLSSGTAIDTNDKGALLVGAGANMKTNSTFLPSRIEVLVRGASATASSGKLTVAVQSIISCEIVAQACGTTGSSTCATVVPSPNGGAMLGTPIASLRKVLLHEAAGAVRCTISNGAASVTANGASLFASGQIQIATNLQLAIYVDSLVIYGLK